ncbi:MAG: biotin carboxylase N-terminal domain-containing protein [Myxococcota bacterium]
MRKILIANRGEIARRILRSVRALGLASVATYSDADAEALHVREADEAVRLGPPPAAESYLSIERVLAAAERAGADAVHPGYGFLSENAEFAEACEGAGLTFIGPPAEVLRRMGKKVEARRIMEAAGVPVLPGTSESGLGDEALTKQAERLGYPLLVKASAGGGGRGMRIVREPGELPGALESARREAMSAFGDDTLLLERYLERPRHIEVQILADSHGRIVHCFERECSIQRRFQKLIEEAPSPAVAAPLRAQLGSAALAAAKAVGYRGAGTVEFVVDAAESFYFLEMNTRLQVEHPVTESITGLDLVELQIRIARGEPLPFAQEDLEITGHAIEVRLYAEDPEREFLPRTGCVRIWSPRTLPGVRYESGLDRGTVIGPHYDALLAKIVAHGATRADACARAIQALEGLGVAGVPTNRDFLLRVLEHPAFAAGEIDTEFIARHLPVELRGSRRSEEAVRSHALAASLHAHERRRFASGPLPPGIPSGWRNNRWRSQEVAYEIGERTVEVAYHALGGGRFDCSVDGTPCSVRVCASDSETIELEIDGLRRGFTVIVDSGVSHVHSLAGISELWERPRFPAPRRDEMAGGCAAPMPGVIREVRVEIGQRVHEGQVLLVLEAMKMEHEIVASHAGVVQELRVRVGQRVDPDDVLIVVEADA